MFDIWGFLLQTLTASGVAVLLLVIKGLFKDKLPPKWHFLVWSILGAMILLPTGFNGRYILFHWPIVVEIIKVWCGYYGFTKVLFPFPVVQAIPKTVSDWVFVIYVCGVAGFALKYMVFYGRLRYVLRKGTIPHDEDLTRIQEIALEHGIKLCRVVEVPGLTGAFVCGIIRPILAVPAEGELDDKVILHELFHLKNRDTLWSALICFLRCIHWCNPLLIYCANRAINDMESRCDQYVLENLEGEERRDYGRILLSMANDRFAKTPGSTCINNGGKNIRDRIEAIARFKKYPAGMGLVSVCAIIILAFMLAVGVQASNLYDSNTPIQIALASARSTPCTTPAGAFDTYAKAVLDQNGLYRVMCAPISMQADIINEIISPYWDFGIEVRQTHGGYYIYNLKHIDKDVYEGLLVIEVGRSQSSQAGMIDLAIQNLRVEKEGDRWIVIPLENFRNIVVADQRLVWGCPELPGFTYSGTAFDMQVTVKVQTIYYVDSWVMENGGNSTYFDTTPNPNAVFTAAERTQFSGCTHLGSESERNNIKQIGLSVAPVFSGEKRPENLPVVVLLEPGWGPAIYQDGGGETIDPMRDYELPDYYAADLYINDELIAQMDLHLQEGVTE